MRARKVLIMLGGVVVIFLMVWSCQSGQYPGTVLDLSSWKLTLPTASRSDVRQPAEVKNPGLSRYRGSAMELTPDKQGVVFRAGTHGLPTIGSSFARSELRQMNGSSGASWSNQGAGYKLHLRQAITHLPTVQPSLVAGQIHGGSEYLLLVRLDGERLYVRVGDREVGELDDAYRLGQPFDLDLVASHGRFKVYYNGTLKVDVAQRCQTCYFKAGVYLQSNASKGEPADSYGAVVLYQLAIDRA